MFSSLISLAALVADFFICYNLSKKFNQDVGMAVLLFLFGIVMIPIMGFSKNYQYDENVIVSENGPISENKQNNYYSNNGSENMQNSASDYSAKKFCQYCGRQINIDSKYCGNCGSEIK